MPVPTSSSSAPSRADLGNHHPHPSFGCREQDTALGQHLHSPTASSEPAQGAAGMGNPGNSHSNQQPNQQDYSLPRVLRKQQYGVCPHSQPGLQHNSPSGAHTTLLQLRDTQGRALGKVTAGPGHGCMGHSSSLAPQSMQESSNKNVMPENSVCSCQFGVFPAQPQPLQHWDQHQASGQHHETLHLLQKV